MATGHQNFRDSRKAKVVTCFLRHDKVGADIMRQPLARILSLNEIRGRVRGKYYENYKRGTSVVLLEPDVAKVFHDSAVVNQALREYLSEHGEPPTLSKAG